MDHGNDAETENKLGEQCARSSERIGIVKDLAQELRRTNQRRVVSTSHGKSLRQARLDVLSRNTPREHLPSGEKEQHVTVNSRQAAMSVSDRSSRRVSQRPQRDGNGCKWQQERGRREAASGRPTKTGERQGTIDSKLLTVADSNRHGGHSSVPNKARSTGGGREPAKRDWRSKGAKARVAEECKRKAIERARKNKRRNRPKRRAAAKAIVEYFDLLPFSTIAQLQ
ncbi:unnamed protein product [Ectocarpus sp. 12 AP-2014]